MLHSRQSGFVEPIIDGFQHHDCDLRCYEADDKWNFANCDFLITYGPMHSISTAILRLGKVANVPPIVFWYTEQLPDPAQNPRIMYLTARSRYLLENGLLRLFDRFYLKHNTLFERLQARAGRFRALGEILALQQLSLLKLVCVFSETNRLLFSQFGLQCKCIPFGYHRSFGANQGLNRDIDVVFLGSTRDSRRNRIIGDLEKMLLARRIKFVIKDGSEQRGSVHGVERTILLNRSRIMLNIMRQPWDDPVFRMLLAAPNNTMLLSEELEPSSVGPFNPNEHFIMAPLAELAEVIEYWLAHEQERQ